MTKWKKLCEELPKNGDRIIVKMSYSVFYGSRYGNFINLKGLSNDGVLETHCINVSYPVCDRSLEWALQK